MLGVAPCLEECAGALHPALTLAWMGIRILAEATNCTLMQSLAVHVLEQLPCRLNLTVFDHALHGYTVVPQPDSTVVVGVILMIVVPVFVLRMELEVPLCERSYTPRVNELFPCTACNLLLELVITDEIETVQLVWSKLKVSRSFCVEMVVDQDAVLVAEVIFKIAGKHSCQSAPFLCSSFVTHEGRDLATCSKLLIPQRLNVIGTVATRRAWDAVTLNVHPCICVSMSEIALAVSIILNGCINAHLDGRVELVKELCVT